ncbi:hypothetical protein [Schleiferilactobacillus perolens]|jgi:hypothetical protein|uniref:Uncharacterized protein n=1 Tax=Schleiferilactobacillus perolens DSM 12744 TaxID=1423792 RepID=A0A0R1N5I4_9LACO|nr:hypothetical protein [Schleiferilactobacillus perolens]KRL13077.1 hypothetical protein FD09_GL002619 [Schleiferilactobacillus perolens DSM 12744]MCI2170699.1 hypothetical protein [Schleiferilactobacillus perolens]
MEEIIKQLAPLLNVLSPVLLGLLAYLEFNKKNHREEHNDDIDSRDKLIESLRAERDAIYQKWLSSEKLVDELRKELNGKKDN